MMTHLLFCGRPRRRLAGIAAGPLLWLALSGCSNPPTDSCMGADCQQQAADMRKKPGMVDPGCTMATGQAKLAVIDHFAMPTVAQPCAIDLDGDGKTDNALMKVIGGLKAAAFDLQATADLVVEAGELIQLLTLTTPDLSNASCASVKVQRGQPTVNPPAYDGSDSFQVNQALPASQALGTLANGTFESARPMDQTTANLNRVELSLPGGYGVEVPLPVNGLHFQGVVRAPQGVLRGELHGAVRMKDVDSRVIPAIARVMTVTINKAPGTASAKQLIATFETKAKCDAMPDLCCATKPATCEITADEVRANKQVQAILQPDVQMFDGDRWAPNPLAEKPDSLSVGLCFTAVGAKF